MRAHANTFADCDANRCADEHSDRKTIIVTNCLKLANAERYKHTGSNEHSNSQSPRTTTGISSICRRAISD